MKTINFYSLKSKKHVIIDTSKVKIVTLKNGRKAAQAIDPETGGKLFKFLSKEALKNFD